MNCADARQLVHPHIDRELDVSRALDLEEHVRTCPHCAARQKSLLSLQSAIANTELAWPAPDALRDKVRAITGPAPKETREATGGQFTWPWKWIALSSAAMAVFLLVMQPDRLRRDRLLDEIVAGHVRSLLAAHLTDVASTDQHTVKPWFDGRLDFAPDVKDFAQQGYSLAGGRLEYLDNHTVAALVYRHNKHIVNVFIEPRAKPANPVTGSATERGYSVVAFDTDTFSYYLISDTDDQTLEKLAELLKTK
jgi:anti-sigma factor RsiW